MLKTSLTRLAFLAVTGVSLSQAAPISLGFISFNDVGFTGTATAFKVNNWTNGLVPSAVPVLTAVNLMNVTLTIDHIGAPAGQSVIVPTTMLAGFNPYVSNDLDKNWQITRAVFQADLSAGLWTLAGGSVVIPATSHLQLVLLPAYGPYFQANNDSWDMMVDTQAFSSPGVPEPAAWSLCGLGFMGVVAIRRRRN